MYKNIFLDKKWQKLHLKQIKKIAGNRYTPELNIDLPIAEIFDGISRSENFYIHIRRHYGNLNREFSRVSICYDNKNIQKQYINLKNKISLLSQLLGEIKEYNIKTIPWNEINKQIKKANEILWKLSKKLREEISKIEKPKKEKGKIYHPSSDIENLSSAVYHLLKIHKELRYFEGLSTSTKAKLSNSPYLFLTGVAGTGKTHLLCDVIEDRVKSKETLPAVLVFGELFGTDDDPFTQLIQKLDLDVDRDRFLSLLNDAGKESGCRTIIAIDALNETKQKDFWKKSLGIIVDIIKEYPNIALVVSVRTGFEGEVITKNLKRIFVQEDHRGLSSGNGKRSVSFSKNFIYLYQKFHC